MTKVIYGYFGHPKSAGTWMSGIMIGVCNAMGWKAYTAIFCLKKTNPKNVESEGYEFIISQNTSYEKVSQLSNYRGVHIIRDPRDMCVSGYFSYKYSHIIPTNYPNLKNLMNKLQELNDDEGILEVIKFKEDDLGFVSAWNYQDPNILELKMEDMTQTPYQNLYNIFDFMGLLDKNHENSLLGYYLFYVIAFYNRAVKKLKLGFLSIKQNKIHPKYLQVLVERLSFEKLAEGREKGQENIKSHYRKGQGGDWKNYFKEEHKALFKEKYGDLLIRLGYEKDNNW
ncbi:MAG: sulfotransferase domain-containing protein [Microscillaceae bacterium]|jgi:hypothetical protein|nr:sulfotransferase domain-containing protein [Microscillaceae bacterium]